MNTKKHCMYSTGKLTWIMACVLLQACGIQHEPKVTQPEALSSEQLFEALSRAAFNQSLSGVALARLSVDVIQAQDFSTSPLLVSPCENKGSISLGFTDSDRNHALSAGDQLQIHFNECKFGAGRISTYGQMHLEIINNTPNQLAAKVSFNRLEQEYEQQARTANFDGGFEFRFEKNSTSEQLFLEQNNLYQIVETTQPHYSESVEQLKQGQVTLTHHLAENSYELSLRGSYRSEVLQQELKFETLTPLKGTFGAWPSQGDLAVTYGDQPIRLTLTQPEQEQWSLKGTGGKMSRTLDLSQIVQGDLLWNAQGENDASPSNPGQSQAALFFEQPALHWKPAELAVYPYDHSEARIPLSHYYEVEVRQGKRTEQLTVYQSDFWTGSDNKAKGGNRNAAVAGNTLSWAHFSFDGEVTVKVSVKSGQNKVDAKALASLLPARFGITAKTTGNSIEFTLNRPGQYSLELGETGYKNGLMILADPPETDIPDPEGEGVLYCAPCNATDLANTSRYHTVYFGPQKHEIWQWHPAPTVKNIYLAGGAMLKGAIQLNYANPKNVRIWGRGSIDGTLFGTEKVNMIEAFNDSSHIHVEGIIISQSSKFAVRLLGENNVVDWVKMPGGWRFNNDGIAAYENSRLTNNFVWANDDGIKLYRDKQYVRDIVAWQLSNGGVFQWAWSTIDAQNIRVKNVDVVHADWPHDGGNQGVFNVRGSSNKQGVRIQKNWVFKNINIDTPVQVLFRLTPEVEHILDDHLFININAKLKPGGINRFEGASASAPLGRITIEDLKINGQCVTPDNAESLAHVKRVQVHSLVIEGDCDPLTP